MDSLLQAYNVVAIAIGHLILGGLLFSSLFAVPYYLTIKMIVWLEETELKRKDVAKWIKRKLSFFRKN